MSQSKEKLDIFSQNLLEFEVDQAGPSHYDYSEPAQDTRKRTMTQKGFEYTKTMKRKAALSKAKEFNNALTDFRFAIATMQNEDELKNELKTKREQFDAVLHAFDEYLQLVVDPLESGSANETQNELKATWEGPEGLLKFAQDRLRELEEDTRSTTSHVTQKSIRSRASSRSSSTSTKDTLLSIKAKKAVLQERLKFTDAIKEQEKTLTKLKLKQEISETLAEEAIYEAEVNEESIVEPILHLPKDSFTTLNRFLNSEQSPIVSQPTSDETFEIVNPMTTESHASHVVISTPNVVTNNVNVISSSASPPTTSTTSVNFGTTSTPNSTINSIGQSSPALSPTIFSRPNTVSSSATPTSTLTTNTCTTFSPFIPRMAAMSTTTLPATMDRINPPNTSENTYFQNSPSICHNASNPTVLPDLDSTQHERVQHEHQLIEAIAKVTQIQRLPQAKPDVFRGDEKDKTKYFLWQKAFDALVDSAPVTDLQKLHLLYQHLDGRAKKVVEQLQYMIEDPAKAYTEARKILKERFGHTAFLETDFENKLSNWPKIGNNDAQGIQEFGDFLQQIKIASQYIPNLKIFEFPSKLQSLVEKLPLWFRNKWSSKVQKLQRSKGHDAFPTFDDFLEEVTFHAERMNIPQLKSYQNSRDPFLGTSVKSQHKKDLGTRTLASRTTGFNEASEKNQDDIKGPHFDTKSKQEKDVKDEPYCPYHMTKTHSLDTCKKFGELPFEERKDFLFKKRLCFNCAKSDKHVAKKCDQTPPKCRICEKGHPTALHNSTKDEKVKEETTSACTQTCDRNKGIRSCARIVLLKVFHRSNPSRETLTYAVLDDQSTDVFVSESLLNQLSVEGQEVNLQVNTIVGTNTIRTKKASGLCIQDIHGEHLPIKVPFAYARDCIPATHYDIATPDVARQWKHLQEIADKIHHHPNVGIGMLIGRNVPTAFQPLSVISGSDDEPWAEEYKFGWTIIGPVCLDKDNQKARHQASVNRVLVQREEILDYGSTVQLKPTQSAPKATDISAVSFIASNSKKKDITSPQQVREMMELDYTELHYSRSVRGTEQVESVEDKRFHDILDSQIHKNENGNWEAPLPFKSDNVNLPNNREQCLKRLLSLKRKLLRNGTVKKEYVEFMQKIFDRSHATRIPEEQLKTEPNKVWYLPHFDVHHPKKPEQIRVVFDCSVVFENQCLNKLLLQGPDLMNSLIGVLMRFRKEYVAITCDIEQMFHSFYVNPEHRNYLRFLWFKDNDLDGPIVEYRMNVHLFGATSSPGVANFSLRRTADVGRDEFGSRAADFLQNDFYVDDGFTSLPTNEEAIDLIQTTQAMCASANLRLHKFASNRREVLEALPADDRAKDLKDLDLRHDTLPVQRSLGTFWCIESDTLGFRIELKDKPATRRGILSTISSVYDPLGIVSPVILVGKQILQDLCSQNVDWDDPLSDDILTRWERWRNDLPLLEEVKVPRCVKPPSFEDLLEVGIHSFADASEKGIGEVSYLRIVNVKDEVHVSFLMAKSRVSPIKPMSIPRLELTAAVVAVNVATMLKNELHYENLQTVYYTDSEVVLGYINNEARRFHTYVGNRVQHIRDRSEPEQWHHVSGSENPADEASRGLTVQEILKDQKWFAGPSFLWSRKLPVNETPMELKENDAEVKSSVTSSSFISNVISPEATKQPQETLSHRVSCNLQLKYFDRFSTWHQAKKWLVHIKRGINILKQRRGHTQLEQPEKNESASTTTPQKETKAAGISVGELIQSEMIILRSLQHSQFAPEIKALQNLPGNSSRFEDRKDARVRNHRIKQTSTLYRLDPFIDPIGLLRVGGRLRRASLPYDVKHPVVIPKSSHITELIIRHFHENIVHHQGRGSTLNAIRQAGYWVINGRSVTAHYISKCITCRKLRGAKLSQKMSDLPEERLEPAAPFTYTGMDVFGPWYIKDGRKTMKRYGLIFTCLCSRAVHLETLNSMETDSFINALRRFINRRGKVRELRSDRGTNFVGAKNELTAAALEECNYDRVQDFLLKNDCDWLEFNMNTPKSSHMGGIWERLIRTVRSVLAGLLQEMGEQLDDESLRTLMTEAENVVNCRPLAVEDLSDVESPAPLTPNQLLTMKSSVVLPPPGNFQRPDLYSRKRWRRVQYLANQFWIRWRREYCALQYKRKKWNTVRRNTKVGDVVLLHDENLSRNKWPLARITKVLPSKDGLVRKVELRITRNGQRVTLERPIQKLTLLVEDDEDREESPPREPKDE